jgi:glutaredoxin
MKHIEVYSTENCPWCVRAKALLEPIGGFDELSQLDKAGKLNQSNRE